MDKRSLELNFSQRVRFLSQALAISGALNIAFLTTFIYFAFRERPSSYHLELSQLEEESAKKKQKVLTNETLLHRYSTMSYHELISELNNKELIESGLRKRDLALASLVNFHHFDLEHALGCIELQHRFLSLHQEGSQEKIAISVFPGLSDYHFQAVQHFAKQEKWPFTAQGLFYELKRQKRPRDKSLRDAFFYTIEFHAMESFFRKTQCALKREALLELLLEGSWDSITEYYQRQKYRSDFTINERIEFLRSYLEQGSQIAARLLIDKDHEHIAKHYDDQALSLAIDLYGHRSSEFEQLLTNITNSPRSETLMQRAREKLFELKGTLFVEEKKEEPVVQQHAVVTKNKPVEKEVPAVVKSKPKPFSGIHVVKEGETLSQIAKKYTLSQEDLRFFNHLDGSTVHPGQELVIPEH